PEVTSQRVLPHEHLPHRVYVLRDHAHTVLYIGVSSRVKARVRSHMASQPWRAEIDPTRTVVMDEMPWETALSLEEAAIQKWQPKCLKKSRPSSSTSSP
ncbi:MAG: GIY-YIG nuclease family protein, partial [Polaromonas sp.]|nr:GIY-YIG nuclease family protein [Polaromonas sp.]